MIKTNPPKIVLCLGLKSSGSTWLYNVVLQILRERSGRAGSEKIAALYADSFAMLPAKAARADRLVIKSHEPSDALMFLARFSRARIFVTVREPRDAVASLMLRFHHAFDATLKDMERQSKRIADLARSERAPVFRYEEQFYEKKETVARLADLLDTPLSKAARDRIFRSLTRDAVRKKITALKKTGKLGRRPTADSFDPTTQWHPGHVGDATVGKFATILSLEQQRSIASATRGYCRQFGYAIKPSRRVARRERK